MTAAARGLSLPERLRLRLSRWLDLRPGEGPLVALLAFAGFALITAYYFLKPVAKSLFLSEFPAEQLRWVYLSIGPVAALVGFLHSWLSKRVRLVPLINGVMGALLLGVVAFRFLLDLPHARGPVAFALSIYQQMFGVLGVALLYLSLNHLLEPRQMRRLIGPIGAGTITGGIAAGYLVNLVVPFVGTEDLLWGTVVLIVLTVAALDIVYWRWPPLGQARPDHRRRRARTLSLIWTQPYLRHLVVLLSLVIACATLADYQFSWAVDRFVPDGDERTAYLGFWFSTISAISLPAQLLVTAPVLRRFGVGPALLFLPCLMLVFGAGMLALPGLVFGTGLKVGDGALRYSLNKSALELLYLPLPLWVKDRTKVFIDTSLDRFAKSGAGAILVILTDLLHVGIRGAAAVTLALALAWVGWAWSLKDRYIQAFRDALRAGHVDEDAKTVALTEPGLVTPLIEGLSARSPEVVQRSLDLLLDAHPQQLDRARAALLELVESEEPEIAAAALRLAGRVGGTQLRAAAIQRLDDPDVGVAAEAVRALLWTGPAQSPSVLDTMGQAGSRGQALAAAACFSTGRDVDEAQLDAILSNEEPASALARLELARSLSRGLLPHRRELLRRLMADADPRVAVAALRGAGDLGDLTLVPFLVTALRSPATRRAARISLRRLGPRCLPMLESYLTDQRLEHEIRRRLPRAIAAIGGSKAFGILAHALNEEDPRIRHQVLRVLVRVVQRQPQLRLSAELVESELHDECHALARLLAYLATPGGAGPARRLFERALREAISNGRIRAFRLLGLRRPGDDWEYAAAGLSSTDARLRATAVEFADGTLPDRLRHLVVPLVDDIAAAEALHRVGPHLDIAPLATHEAYELATQGADRWLVACALAAATEEGRSEVLDAAEQRREDPDPWIREAARTCVEELSPVSD